MSLRRSAIPYLTVVLIFGGLVLRVTEAAACAAVSSILSQRKPAKWQVVPARPFKGNDDPLKAAAVLMGEYLALAKQPKIETTVTMDVLSDGGSKYRAAALLGEKRFEAPFEFPATLNQALTGLVETVTDAAKVSFKAKKLLPFLNETASSAAYLRYADGSLVLDAPKSLAPADAERAAHAFEEAIKADYNYVFAYGGLAEALAAWSVAESGERAKTLRAQAKAEMTKAKLLNPYRAKNREERMNWYLKKARCLENS